jgi:hypothetical protein
LATTIRTLIGYFVVSTLTLPFLNAFWIGELPVLALIQLPKIELAVWFRNEVIEAMQWLGLSRGSRSPDLIFVRPYGLALAYVATLGPLIGFAWLRGRLREHRRGLFILLAAATIDFIATLALGQGRYLTIY